MTAPARKLGVGDRANVVRCNHCRDYVLHAHRAAHAFECRSKRNRAKLAALNLEKNGQQLYAVVATRRRRGKWSAPFIEHVHADSPQHARAQFLAGQPGAATKIVEAGLAIGWFQDEAGNVTG